MPSPTISARIPQPLYDLLQATALDLAVSPTELVARALYHYLTDLNEPPPPDPAALEARITALEAAVFAGAGSKPKRIPASPKVGLQTGAHSLEDPALENLSAVELRSLARTLIGPGSDKDPTTRKPLRRDELIALLQAGRKH